MNENVFIAIGSNCGNRVQNVKAAIRAIELCGLELVSTGFLYQSDPMYYENQPAFLNTCVKVSTQLTPHELLKTLKLIEANLGREKTIRNGPRCIDLDIIFFGNQVIDTPELVIPHPRMTERLFVLRPLVDMDACLKHPVLGTNISKMALDIPEHEQAKCVAVFPAIQVESTGVLPLKKRSYIVGILNVTPDSFSDGGQFANIDSALSHAKKIIAEGADILDIGGESTRPNATSVEAEEEQRRVIDIIRRLRSEYPTVPISIDTYKASTAKAAIEAGASIVNDVSGGLIDPEMLPTVAKLQVPYICSQSGRVGSHVIGPILDENSVDALKKVENELLSRVNACMRAGIYRWNLMLDPGLGFGKSGNVNFQIIKNLNGIFSGKLFGFSVMIGASRKRFVRDLIGNGSAWSGTETDALLGTAAVTTAAIASEVVNFHRVHDVALMKRVIDVSDRIYRE